MCGIAGIVAYAERTRPSEPLLGRLGQCIAHRGPDGQGVLVLGGPDAVGGDAGGVRGGGERSTMFAGAGTGAVVGLVHRRLAVLDPEPRSDQPMTAEYRGRRLHLVYNGEIYNFRSLRDRLERLLPGFAWRTRGDSEVLLAAYFAFGTRCVDELLGMFAFAIYDESDGSLFLARDRMGQKPLYLAITPGPTLERIGGTRFDEAVSRPAAPVADTQLDSLEESAGADLYHAGHRGEVGVAASDEGDAIAVVGAGDGAVIDAVAFSSELSALAEIPWVDRTVDETAVSHFLATGYVPSPWTIYAGVCKVPPATTLLIRPGLPVERRRYFDCNSRALAGELALLDDAGKAVRVRAELAGAVESQRVSDVPIGCFLSGGIDSSIVALCMQQAMRAAGGDRAHTFTVAFDDPRYDESDYAAEVARHLGTEHHTLRVTPDVAADLPALARSYGEPFGDSSCLPTFYLSRAAREHVKVALAGDGGDELFCGYDRYRAMAHAERLTRSGLLPLAKLGARALGVGGGAAGGGGAGLVGGHPKGLRARVGRFVGALDLPPAERYESLVRLFPPGLCGAPPLSGSVAGQRFPAGDVVEAAMALDRVTYLEGDLLAKVDRASMRVGLEVRAPFMDHRLVRLAAGLSRRDLLLGGKKGMLRRAFGGDLPAAVFSRPKMGFAVPIGEWFRGPLRQMAADLVLGTHGFMLARCGRAALERLLQEHQSARIDHSQRIFALVMLELWHQNRAASP